MARGFEFRQRVGDTCILAAFADISCTLAIAHSLQQEWRTHSQSTPVLANPRSVFPHRPAATAAIAVPVVHGKKSDLTCSQIDFPNNCPQLGL